MKFVEADEKFFKFKICAHCHKKNKLVLTVCRACKKPRFKKRRKEIKQK